MLTIVRALLVIGLAASVLATAWQVQRLQADVQAVHHDIAQIDQRLRRSQAAATLQRSQAEAVLRRPHAEPAVTAVIAPERLVQVTVRRLDYVFQPTRISVTVGTRVIWVNRTSEEHSITSAGAHLFNRTLPVHGRVELVFLKPGRYPYLCRFHPYQRGEIVVSR